MYHICFYKILLTYMDNRVIEIRQSNYLSFNFKSKKVVRDKTLDKAFTFNLIIQGLIQGSCLFHLPLKQILLSQ